MSQNRAAEKSSAEATKPNVVVPVVRVVVVAAGAEAEIRTIEPRTPAQNRLTQPLNEMESQIETHATFQLRTIGESNSFLKLKLLACFTCPIHP